MTPPSSPVAPGLRVPSAIGITCSSAHPRAVACDLLVAPAFECDRVERFAAYDAITGDEVSRAMASGELRGALGEGCVTPILDPSWRSRRLAIVGAGAMEDFGATNARRFGTAAGLLARQRGARTVGIVAHELTANPDLVQALADGLTLASFNAGGHKTSAPPPNIDEAVLFVNDAAHAAAAVRGQVIGHYCNVARELVSEPPNFLTPRGLANRAMQLAEEAGITIGVLDETDAARLGLRQLLAVARGSVEPPRMIVLRYDPVDAPSSPVIGLVGKGVTFDAGGLSEKRPDDLDLMKYDMAGGAAVIAAVCALGLLRPRVRCVGVVAATENMPGGGAMRPGDVVTSAGGMTVEVVDCDAEGRLLLADALWYARALGATHLVDVATLTSGCIAALGEFASGLVGTPETWTNRVRRAAERAGEPVCRLPLPVDRPRLLHSDVADLANRARVPGAPIVAAAFLKIFTGGLPWAHLDVAGTAWTDLSTPYQLPGPTGTPVRTLVELVTDAS